MKIGETLRVTQQDVYNNLVKKKKHKKSKRRREKSTKDELAFSDIEQLMRHDSYRRGPKGAIRQKTWGK
ncbi:hypothetical protein [Clostridium botulinum]|uniref:hypothetical protein n=1 Tax=Clostridium botulinum TaxID=1491 RepID=UPI00249EED23|nr:hypothetical protein [Clostridium botulinum]MDU4596463.1 hypothetical protein [Clostridium sporogenes]WGZ48098.1 hypothetical protein HEQ52_18295 [Clostridium botulinum]